MDITTQGAYTGRVGSIEFDTSLTGFSAERTAEGFKILIPVSVTLRHPSAGQKVPMVRNLRGRLSAVGPAGVSVEIGRIVCESSYRAPADKLPAVLEWRGPHAALAFYEQVRQGGPPKFEFNLTGDVYFIVQEQGQADKLCWAPEPFNGLAHVTYPADIWASTLRRLRVAEIVIIEIPLPSDPPSGWDKVWSELSYARSELERGGETAWRGCATAVRRALEEWRKIEKELDPGNKQLAQRSKQERFDDLRRYLKNYAAQPQHTGVEEWSRKEAALMLAGLSALLATRKP